MSALRITDGTLPAPPGPAGSDGKRSCGSCGAQHPPSARFCWRCHDPVGNFAHQSVAADAAGPVPRIRYSLIDSTPTRRGVSLHVPARLRTAIAFAALAVLAAAVFRPAPYDIPSTLAGIPRAASPGLVAQQESWSAAFDGTRVDDVALFGRGSDAEFMVLAYGGSPADSAAALRELAEPWAGVTGTAVRTGSMQVREGSVAAIACAPVSGDSFGAMCAWADPDGFVGAVVSFGAPMPATAGIAASAAAALPA